MTVKIAYLSGTTGQGRAVLGQRRGALKRPCLQGRCCSCVPNASQ
jgi:hypothetical protein